MTTSTKGAHAMVVAPAEPAPASAGVPLPATPNPEASAAAAAEAAELLRRQDGFVTLKYEMYAEPFAIAGGSTTAAAVDAEYCLSFVMPKCRIHLSALEGRELTARMVAEEQERYAYYVHEEEAPMPPPDADGEVPAIACNAAYHGLLDGNTYHVYLTEDSEEEARMMARAKVAWAHVSGDDGGGHFVGALREERCTCIMGVPCTSALVCLDWEGRAENAAKCAAEFDRQARAHTQGAPTV